ncbi:MAG: chorion class high-cysteine HCB protein 13 [Lachnospiraceae bacterium]
MSDLAATNCGCGCDNERGCNSIIWLIILLSCCGCGNNGLFGGNDCNNNSCIWIIILLLFCCNGNDCGFGCF